MIRSQADEEGLFIVLVRRGRNQRNQGSSRPLFMKDFPVSWRSSCAIESFWICPCLQRFTRASRGGVTKDDVVRSSWDALSPTNSSKRRFSFNLLDISLCFASYCICKTSKNPGKLPNSCGLPKELFSIHICIDASSKTSGSCLSLCNRQAMFFNDADDNKPACGSNTVHTPDWRWSKKQWRLCRKKPQSEIAHVGVARIEDIPRTPTFCQHKSQENVALTAKIGGSMLASTTMLWDLYLA